jgi:glutamate-1-semialdehyde aminotransferase
LLWGAPDADALWLRDLHYTHGSYGHAAEYALADALGDVYAGLLPSGDMAVRFFSNGGDACAAATRVARAATGRDAIATQGYHGAQADFAHKPATRGYPQAMLDLHRRFEFGDTSIFDEAGDISCVMVEVPAWDDERMIADTLACYREQCDMHNVPFIVDDVVGGFRFGLGGSCERYGVKPDMVCLGKAMSAVGGVSALIGRRDLVGMLDGDVFYSTTFGGNPGPCAVAAATVRWLSEHRAEVYSYSEGLGPLQSAAGRILPETKFVAGHLAKIGLALKDGLNSVFAESGVAAYAGVVGQPERSVLQFDEDGEWLRFCSLMIDRGVMIHRPQFPTLAHTMEHVDRTLEAAREVVSEMIR